MIGQRCGVICVREDFTASMRDVSGRVRFLLVAVTDLAPASRQRHVTL